DRLDPGVLGGRLPRGRRRRRVGVPALWTAPPRPLRRPAARAAPRAAMGPVAVPRRAPDSRRRGAGLARRGGHAAHRAPRTGARGRRAHPLGEGRGAQPDRVVQGAGDERGGDARPGARRARARRAHRGERGRGARGVRGGGAGPGARLRARDHPARDPRHDPRDGRGAHARARAHWRRGQGGARVRRGERLRRHVDAARALPCRGKEDDGDRDRRAARLATARRDRVPHRRRDGAHRDVEGVRRAARRRVVGPRGATAADGRRAGHRLRADRPRVRGRQRPRHAVGGPRDARERAAGAGPARRPAHPARARGEPRRRRGGGRADHPRRHRAPGARQRRRRRARGRLCARRARRARARRPGRAGERGGGLQHRERRELPGL
ncbi:MAG: Threonine synthase, partial [uncultured Gemmatimonadaceae bacterium]